MFSYIFKEFGSEQFLALAKCSVWRCRCLLCDLTCPVSVFNWCSLKISHKIISILQGMYAELYVCMKGSSSKLKKKVLLALSYADNILGRANLHVSLTGFWSV